jgi:2-polyprenyl-3-methyl-5-hydroxy-6-metoxy-1,4-benzoquinol methylase
MERRIDWAELCEQPLEQRPAILDCACGIGTQALGLALLGHSVHGTDISPVAVERARCEAAQLGVAVTFGVADMRTLDRDVGRVFDVVLAFDNSLPHLLGPADMQLAAHAIRRTLRPGGVFLASTRDYDAQLAHLAVPCKQLRVRHKRPMYSEIIVQRGED